MKDNTRHYLTAIYIDKGIIQLIDPDGNVRFYRQRGIQTLSKMQIVGDIAAGLLDHRWESCQELPKNYSISFEDPEIQGRALATYPTVLKMRKSRR